MGFSFNTYFFFCIVKLLIKVKQCNAKQSKVQYDNAITKRKKHAKCIVELYKHVGFFKNTREVLEKHEPQANASCTSLVFLKNPKHLYKSRIYKEHVFYFFYKMYHELLAVVLMT